MVSQNVFQNHRLVRLDSNTAASLQDSAEIISGHVENLFDRCANTCVTLKVGNNPQSHFLHMKFSRAWVRHVEVYIRDSTRVEGAKDSDIIVELSETEKTKMNGSERGWHKRAVDNYAYHTKASLSLSENFQQLQVCSIDLYAFPYIN